VIGALIALLAPNTQTLMRYSANLKQPLRLPSSGSLASVFSGAPAIAATPAMAVICGLLFAVAFAQLWRPAIFIYFNF
jgi:hypothetical protein